MKGTSVHEGIDFLAAAGLNLFAVFDGTALPAAVTVVMAQSGVPVADYGRLVLLGHGGRQLWAQLQAVGPQTVDPVDHYSLTITRQFITRYLDDADHVMLYPHEQYVIPLSLLGELAGWSYPSPLGQGIHPTFGLWFAYRTAFLTNYELATTVRANEALANEALVNEALVNEALASGRAPCDTCTHKPCLTACPAGAVRPDKFDLLSCAGFRVAAHSVCADRCLARLACPIAPEHRYSLAQIQYHYRHSLATIRRYQEREQGRHKACPYQRS